MLDSTDRAILQEQTKQITEAIDRLSLVISTALMSGISSSAQQDVHDAIMASRRLLLDARSTIASRITE